MTKKKYIERRTVLQAIRTEPLVKGSFVLQSSQGIPEEDPNCPVCAVGAVLRHAGMNNLAINDFGEELICHGAASTNREVAGNIITEYLEKQMYLHALSVKFEDQASRTGNGIRTRKIVSDFVKKNFPLKIKLDASL